MPEVSEVSSNVPNMQAQALASLSGKTEGEKSLNKKWIEIAMIIAGVIIGLLGGAGLATGFNPTLCITAIAVGGALALGSAAFLLYDRFKKQSPSVVSPQPQPEQPSKGCQAEAGKGKGAEQSKGCQAEAGKGKGAEQSKGCQAEAGKGKGAEQGEGAIVRARRAKGAIVRARRANRESGWIGVDSSMRLNVPSLIRTLQGFRAGLPPTFFQVMEAYARREQDQYVPRKASRLLKA